VCVRVWLAFTAEARPVAPTAAGTIMIRDIRTGAPLAHFRAHKSELRLLAWDPTGTLLLTVPTHGQHCYLWSFALAPTTPSCTSTSSAPATAASTRPRTASASPALTASASAANGSAAAGATAHSVGIPVQTLVARKVYRVFRGLSPAVIASVSFTADSRWLALTSTRGTTHVFPIRTDGGPITVASHVRVDRRVTAHLPQEDEGPSTDVQYAGSGHTLPTVTALLRLKPSAQPAHVVAAATIAVCVVEEWSFVCVTVVAAPMGMRVCVVWMHECIYMCVLDLHSKSHGSSRNV
jgi:hypothetical protein